MIDEIRKNLRDKQTKLMEDRKQLEAIQTQRNNKLECFYCLEKRMQDLDEEADRIEWILQREGET